ncbi:MAG TPA: DUF5667 domain-containing protein [Actinomycetota bacterium]|nr:DUF5667 domain-containing protein [Actinomycetota bacterium]
MTDREGFHDRDTDALDRALDAVVAGDEALLPEASMIRAALRREVPDAVARDHLAAIRSAADPQLASPERSPEPDTTKLSSPERYPDAQRRPAADIVPIDDVRKRRVGRGRRRGAVAVLAAAMLLTFGSGSALAAAAGTKPGDALYGVKRASERIALAMRLSPESKAALHLQLAERRIDEIDALAAEGQDVTDLAADFAASLEAAGEGASSEALGRILERTRAHIAHLNEILNQVPEQAQQGLERAIDNAERQQQRTEERRQQTQDRGKPDAPGRSGDAPGKKNRGR